MNIIEWLRVIFLGIVEGITEWLPCQQYRTSDFGRCLLEDECTRGVYC